MHVLWITLHLHVAKCDLDYCVYKVFLGVPMTRFSLIQTHVNKHTHVCMITYRTSVYTVYVFDHVDAEAVSGDSGEHLPGASPPG